MDVLKYLATPGVGDESEIRFPIPELKRDFRKSQAAQADGIITRITDLYPSRLTRQKYTYPNRLQRTKPKKKPIMAGKADVDAAQLQPLSQPAYCLSYQDVLQELSTDAEEGLSSGEAQRRLEQHGHNELEGGESVSFAKIIIRQIANAMMLVRIPRPYSPANPHLYKKLKVNWIKRS